MRRISRVVIPLLSKLVYQFLTRGDGIYTVYVMSWQCFDVVYPGADRRDTLVRTLLDGGGVEEGDSEQLLSRDLPFCAVTRRIQALSAVVG